MNLKELDNTRGIGHCEFETEEGVYGCENFPVVYDSDIKSFDLETAKYFCEEHRPNDT